MKSASGPVSSTAASSAPSPSSSPSLPLDDPHQLLLASRRCSECLMSPNRIVPASRAGEILRECISQDKHFVCHKGQMAGLIVHCRGVHDVQPARAYRFAAACGIPVVEVDPDNLKGSDHA